MDADEFRQRLDQREPYGEQLMNTETDAPESMSESQSTPQFEPESVREFDLEPEQPADSPREHYQEGGHETQPEISSEPDGATDAQSDQPSNPQTLFSWEAPIRAYKKQTAGVLRFYVAVAVLLSLIVFFFKEFILIIPIWAIMFLVYALTITPPESVRHAITKFGLHSAHQMYPWDALSHFYFIKKFDYDIVVIFTRMAYAHPLYLVTPTPHIKEEVLHHLSHHLIYQESPNKTLTDKMAEWLTTLMPEDGGVSEAPMAHTTEPEAHPIHDEVPVEQPLSHQASEPTEEPPHQPSQYTPEAPWQE